MRLNNWAFFVFAMVRFWVLVVVLFAPIYKIFLGKQKLGRKKSKLF